MAFSAGASSKTLEFLEFTHLGDRVYAPETRTLKKERGWFPAGTAEHNLQVPRQIDYGRGLVTRLSRMGMITRIRNVDI